MIKGTAWTLIDYWHEEDEPTQYRIKVAYQYTGGQYVDGRYMPGIRQIEVIEYPENASHALVQYIDDQLPEIMDEILQDDGNDEWDTEDYWEEKLQNQ